MISHFYAHRLRHYSKALLSLLLAILLITNHLFVTYASTQVTTSTSSNAITNSTQRKTWYDGTRYWVAFHAAANSRIEFWYSTDGTSFSENTSARISIDTNDFTIFATPTHAHIAYTNGFDISAQTATSYPGTSFGWGSATTVLDGSAADDAYTYPTISKDTDNYVWVAARHYLVSNYTTQPNPGKDTYIDSANTTTNYGTATTLLTQAESLHALIQFDLTSIPSTAVCLDSSLSLWSANGPPSVTYDIYSLTSSVSDWQANEATWDIYKTGSNWPGSAGAQTSGTDYESDASPPTITFPNNSINTQATADLTTGSNLNCTRISGWFGATNTNYGLIVGATGSTASRNWHSGSATTAGYRPQFSVDYSTYSVVAVQANTTHATSSWGTPETLAYTTNQHAYPSLARLSSGNMYLVYANNTAVFGLAYDGADWGTTPSNITTTSAGLSYAPSLASNGSNELHLANINASGNVVYRRYSSNAWGTGVAFDENASNAYPIVGYDSFNNQVKVAWIRSNTIYLRTGKSPFGTSNWGSEARVITSSGSNTWPSIEATSVNTQNIAFMWLQGSDSPYSIRFEPLFLGNPPPELTFTIDGVATSTSTNGVTTNRTTEFGSIHFGNVTPTTPVYAAHQLYVESNAVNGYTVTARLSNYLQGLYPANNIDPFPSAWSTPATWSTPTGTTINEDTGWFGANTSDTRVTGWSSASAKFGGISSTPVTVMQSSSSDAGTTVYVTYAIEVNNRQPTDLYSGTLTYTLTPSY